VLACEVHGITGLRYPGSRCFTLFYWLALRIFNGSITFFSNLEASLSPEMVKRCASAPL